MQGLGKVVVRETVNSILGPHFILRTTISSTLELQLLIRPNMLSNRFIPSEFRRSPKGGGPYPKTPFPGSAAA